jgi:hypothetical protein
VTGERTCPGTGEWGLFSMKVESDKEKYSSKIV